MPRILVRGVEEKVAETTVPAGRRGRGGSAAPTVQPSSGYQLFNAELQKSVRCETGRDAGATEVELAPDDRDLVEIEFDEGVKLWTSGEDFARDFGMSQSRAGAVTLAFPTTIDVGGGERGLTDVLIPRVVRVFKLRATQAIARAGARVIAKKIEDQLSKEGPGVYQCRNEASSEGCIALGSKKVQQIPPADGPVLLLLHGTASSTNGSFGELWNPSREQGIARLGKRFEGRVYGFEHRTLTESPIDNVLALLEALPRGIKLHVVSHSRGGIVGEILARCGRSDVPDPFDQSEIAVLERLGRPEDAAKLRKLSNALRDKRVVIERFIRVACPARGTTLASERLDRFLSIMRNLVALAPGLAGEIASGLADLTAAVIQQRTNPKELPGLEAQMPSSPLMRVLNQPQAKVDSDLTVISGDMVGSGVLKRLKVFAGDLFFRRDNDLVVDTESMYGGAGRDSARFFFHQAPEVDHFSYFENTDSVNRLLAALEGDVSGFAPLKVDQTIMEVRAARAAPRPDAPVVYYLPGVLGSHLQSGKDRVWLDYFDLALGKIEQLRMGATNVTPDGLLGEYYGALAEALERTHEVVHFPFDWRLPIETEAKRLAEAIEDKLKEIGTGRPIRILAHSMGGLVARTMIARYGNVWADMCRHPGARLLMLGTPNGGSFAPVSVLLGCDPIVRQLELLDLRHDMKGLVGLIREFDGLLNMLPAKTSLDFYDPGVWSQLNKGLGQGFPVPAQGALDASRRFRSEVLDQAPVDPDRMFYVAGKAEGTIEEIRIDSTQPAGQQIKFVLTPEGDGRVTWASGLVPGLKAWFADVDHGELPNAREHFDAYVEILETGTTERLSRQRPPVARGSRTRAAKLYAADVLHPTARDLAAAAVGTSGRRRGRTVAAARLPVKLEVVHGDLCYCTEPVFVGHYIDDEILHAERQIDRQLHGRLSEARAVGQYPGPIGSAAVVLPPTGAQSPPTKPRGAVVIGLGKPGELAPGQLTESYRRGIVQLALVNADLLRAGQVSRDVKGLTTNSLMIGTGQGGLPLEDCAYAILRAIDEANVAILRASQGDVVPVQRVRFIELYGDTAHLIHKTLERIVRDGSFQCEFSVEPDLATGGGGRNRVYQEPPGDWWRRIQVNETEEGALNFKLLTDRARVEKTQVQTQAALVDQLVARTVNDASADLATGRTLFDLLVPNDLKEYAPDRQDLVLIVDERSARFPWELLSDRKDRSGLPLAVEAGALRQLESDQYRKAPAMVTQDAALVIGDTVSDLPALPGAEKEAGTVADRLSAKSFAVTRLIKPKPVDVLNELYAGPYRVLHLAGHGIYEERVPKSGGKQLPPLAGMVLAKDMYLTPAEIEQMRAVPELVFINCCHLGRVDGRAAERIPFNRLAANVATQFIRMGVRAVVAAGWAVDDEAAMEFAQAFYDAMLAGETFGDAVLLARKRIYRFQAERGVNTWGAYQCYGDPFYRLVRRRSDTASTGEPSFVSGRELAVEADNLIEKTRGATEKEVERLRKQARLLASYAKRRWGDKKPSDAGMWASLGLLHGSLDLFGEAIELCKRAFDEEVANYPVRVIEQYYNYRVRLDAEQALEPPALEDTRRQAAKRIEESIKGIERLVEVDVQPEQSDRERAGRLTVERLSLLGGAYKRLALVTPDANQRRAALQKMSEYYRRAHELALHRRPGVSEREAIDPYPVTQWWAAEVVLAATSRASAVGKDQVVAGVKWLTMARDKVYREESFWTDVAKLDAEVVLGLLQGDTKQSPDALSEGYRRARERGAMPSQFRSVIEQLQWTHSMLEHAAGRWQTHAERLRSVLQKLGTDTSSG